MLFFWTSVQRSDLASGWKWTTGLEVVPPRVPILHRMLVIHAQALSWVGQQRKTDLGCKTLYQPNEERRWKWSNWPCMSSISKCHVVQTERNRLIFDLLIFGLSLSKKSESIEFLRIVISILQTLRVIGHERKQASLLHHGAWRNQQQPLCCPQVWSCRWKMWSPLKPCAAYLLVCPRKNCLDVMMIHLSVNIPLALPRRRRDSLTKLSSLYILSIASLVTPSSLTIPSTSSRSSGTWCGYAAKSYSAWVIAYRKRKCTVTNSPTIRNHKGAHTIDVECRAAKFAAKTRMVIARTDLSLAGAFSINQVIRSFCVRSEKRKAKKCLSN